ncbi:MAG: Bro-N domain-containing protein [Comamonas sp.]|jgi:prophage antirepressor-like protein|uniref:BRO-N domain-containing protein n=1 Tax=Comamonas sp. TaxID=34028 RepID=UPI0028311596|nr:Bro-N domain-containing protein [Comamonas sp.]MDR0215906.1 Bro-N domain-containing protein [Comamonas sp.]
MADTLQQSTLAFSAESTPSIFNFGTHAVRIIVRDGQPWFVASDVCAALGYVNTSKAVADHLDDDERSHEQLDRSRMGSKAVIINESGLYALVLRSRKPEARKFAKWVTGEVLPSIRKSGRYEKPGHEITMNELTAKMVTWVDSGAYPMFLFMPVVNAVLCKLGFDLSTPGMSATQAQEVAERLDRLSQLFHPMSSQFADVIGIRRALHGQHPKLGMKEPGYLQLLPN